MGDAIKALGDRVRNNSVTDPITGCWLWARSVQRNGYGQVKAFGRNMRAHRLSYLVANGRIDCNLEIMHSCGNRACVNSDHLRAGTHQENMRDVKQKTGAANRRSKPVEVDGVRYGGMREAARALATSHQAVRYWLKSGRAKLLEV